MKVVQGLLNSIGNFSNEEVKLCRERATTRNFQQNEILLNKDDVF